MRFFIEELNENDWFVDGHYVQNEDALSKIISYTSWGGGYEVYLGEHYHLILDVDCETGRCYGMNIRLSDIANRKINIDFPIASARKAKLYFENPEDLEVGGGCHYLPFKCGLYIDYAKSLIYIGEINAVGEYVEFAKDTFAIVKNNQVLAFIIKVS